MVEVHENDTCLRCGVASKLVLCPRCATRGFIKELVDEKQGCKSVELATLVAMWMAKDPEIFHNVNVPDLIEEMRIDGTLVEVEYILPNMDDRVKSFLLPKGTEVYSDFS